MNDREILELAAKGAGLKDAVWCDFYEGMSITGENGLKELPWNALNSDHEAFNLQVACGMRVYVLCGGGDDYTVAAGDELTHKTISCKVDHQADKYAATRRAIVLCAAEIGKAMP